MSEEDTTIVRCPSCGSPINMGASSGTCQYCGTVVERRPGEPQSEPVVVTRVYSVSSSSAQQRKTSQQGGCGCGIAIIVAVVLFVGGIIAATTLSFRQASSLVGLGGYHGWAPFRNERIMDLLQVVPRDGPGDDMLVMLQQDNNTLLGLIDSSGRTLRWRSAPLSKDGRQGRIALGHDTVYLADQTRLQALRLSDGTPIWQASMGVELPSGCDDCLIVLGDRVIVALKDHTLQAFDSRSGQSAWSMRLAATPRQLPVVGGKLALVQTIEGQGAGEIDLVDPASGRIGRRITPVCQHDDPSAGTAQFYPSSMVVPTPDGAGLIAFIDSSETCAQRWDAAADGPAWQTWFDNALAPSSWTAHSLLLDGQRMFMSKDSALSVLDMSNGQVTTLVRDKDYHLTPLFARSGIIVVKATPTWDSNRSTLWGLDGQTGERRWQYSVQAKEWFGDSGFNEWGAQLTPSGVAVVQVPGDTRELIVERLDLKTGASVGRQVTTIDGRGSTTVWDNRWTERRAWLVVDTTLYSIDLVSGEVTSTRA